MPDIVKGFLILSDLESWASLVLVDPVISLVARFSGEKKYHFLQLGVNKIA